jgi:hypothetical protein
MTYMILDSTGSAVASFDDETAARATMRAIVQYEPEAAEHVVMIAYDDDGTPVNDAVTYDDLPPAVILEHADCVLVAHSASYVRSRSRIGNRYVPAFSWGARVDAAHDHDVIAAAQG